MPICQKHTEKPVVHYQYVSLPAGRFSYQPGKVKHMNKDLERAFTSATNARKALDELLEEKSFHSDAWKQAFYNALDQIESLKSASVRDAATLGFHYIHEISNLMEALINVPPNALTVADLCSLGQYAGQDLLDCAERCFESVLVDLSNGVIIEQPVIQHKLRFNNEEDLSAAWTLLVEFGFPKVVRADNALSLVIETEESLDGSTQAMILESVHCLNYKFNMTRRI